MPEKFGLERGMRRLADDELMHWKYVKRVRGKNGKYRYYYDNNTGTSKKKANVKSTTNTTVNPSSKAKMWKPKRKHDAIIAAAQAAAQNMPMYQLKNGNLIDKVVAGYKIVKKFIDKKLLINLKRRPRLDLLSLIKW